MSTTSAPPATRRHWWQRNQWWIRRIASLPVHLFAFAIGVFFLVRLIPGDPAFQAVGPEADEETYLAAKEQMGLDGSIFEQFRTFIGRLLHLDLGVAFTSKRPVRTELMERFPGTLEIALLALAFLLLLTFILTLITLVRPKSLASRLVRGYSQMAGAIPEFVLGVFAIFIFYHQLRIVPAPTGRIDPGMVAPEKITGMPLTDAMLRGEFDIALSNVTHLALPVIVLGIAVSPILLKQLIATLDNAAYAAPTLFKVAAGASYRSVVLSTYRRAIPVAVALFGMIFGYLLGGAVIMETLFGLGGMGMYAVSATKNVDLPALQGFLLAAATISLLVYLVVDVVNMLLDARRRPGVGDAS